MIEASVRRFASISSTLSRYVTLRGFSGLMRGRGYGALKVVTGRGYACYNCDRRGILIGRLFVWGALGYFLRSVVTSSRV